MGLGGRAEIEAVGHRVVHGGERFSRSVRIDEPVLQGIEENIDLAPLHNPANLRGIRAAQAVLGGGVPQAAVFDTAFHQTLPAHAYLYAIPYQYYRRYRVRRYGFHGTSHRYVRTAGASSRRPRARRRTRHAAPRNAALRLRIRAGDRGHVDGLHAPGGP
jgi:acetate kinase